MSQTPQKPSFDLPTSTNEVPEVVNADLTGKTLAEFQVERLLGRGGMGDVYLANQTGLNRHVAVKVLRADFLSKPAYLSRFEIEATAIAKLNHPNIVHVYTLGCVDNIRFIAMEYVQGTNLKDYVLKKGALDLPLAYSIMRQTGQAIAAAAEVGLIHRDIKPENILLTKKGRVKVADFGLCRDQEAEPVHLTQPGVTMGTPTYMSPEQAQGQELDHRSDLYSLGVTFYYMLAGVPPFRGDTALALAIKHVKETPPNLRVHRPDIPVELDLMVMKLMAKKPDDRFQSATEMLQELTRIKDKLLIGTPQEPQPGDFRATGQAQTLLDGGSQNVLAAASRSDSLSLSLSKLAQGVRSSMFTLMGPRLLIAIALFSIAIGAGLGWLSRTPDLIGKEGEGGHAAPGLWLTSGWKATPRQPSAEAQYRRAQILTPPDEQLAAWLAVPGHFPTERTWAAKAYIQLGRLLFREKDKRGLAALADDLERWKDPRGKEPLLVELELMRLLRVGAKLLDREDLEGVVDGLDRMELAKVYDTAILELAFEIVQEARQLADRSNPRSPAEGKLSAIQAAILPKLMLSEAFRLGAAARLKPPGS